MIVVIEKNENGKIEFTKEELEQLLEKARAEGICEAQVQKPNYINPLQSPFTCGTPKGLNEKTSAGNPNPFYVTASEASENPV